MKVLICCDNARRDLLPSKLLVNKLKPLESDFIQKEANAVNMTPWRHGHIIGVLLLAMVIFIYALFADFSVL